MKEVLHQLRQIAIYGLLLIVSNPISTIFASAPAPEAAYPPQLVAVPSPRFELDQTIFMYIHENLGPLVGERVQVWRSVDDGETWTRVYQTEYRYGVGGLLVVGLPYPERDTPMVYLHLSRGDWPALQLLRSIDGGDTWEERTSPQCYGPVLTDDANVLFSNCIQLDPWNDYVGINRSQDGSLTWEQVWSDTSVFQAVPSPAYSLDNTVIATTDVTSPSFPVVIASVNGGATWEARDQGLCNMSATAMVLSPDFHRDQTLFVSQRGILFKSENAGLSWRQVYAPEGQTCEDYPLFRFDDLNISPDYPVNHVLFWEQSESTIYASYDDGRSWQILRRVGRDLYVRRPASARSSAADRRLEQTGFFDDHPATIVGEKTAGVAFWTFLPLVNARGPEPLPLTLFITAHNIPLRSDDGGVTWYEMTLPPYRSTFLPMLVASP